MSKNLVLVLVILAGACLSVVLFLTRGDGPDGDGARVAPPTPAAEGADGPNAALGGADAGQVPPPAEASQSAAGREALVAEQPKAATSGKAAEGVEVVGRLVDKLGTPIAGAEVALGGGFGFGFLGRDRESQGATSGPDGLFRVPGVESGSHRLSARADGFAPLERHEIAVPAVARHDVGDIVLAMGARLMGRVVDPNGRGVGGAELRTSDPSRMWEGPFGNRGPLLATSAADGSFDVSQLAVGPWRVLVSSTDHPDKTFEGETTRPGELQAGLSFELPPGSTIEGVVLGIPAGALSTVVVRGSGAAGGGDLEFFGGLRSLRETAVEPGGRFALRGLVPEQSYSVQLREKPGTAGREFWELGPRSAPLSAKAGDRGLELHWQEEGVATLQVVDARTKAPIARLRVDAGVAFAVPVTGPDGERQREFTGGLVRIGNLYPRLGSKLLQVEIRAAGYADRDLEGIEIAPGQTLDLGVIELEPVPTLVVRVIEAASGAPVPDAEVSLGRQPRQGPRGGPGQFEESLEIRIGSDGDGAEFIDSNRPLRRARTDEQGIATLSSLEGETCVLSVSKPGFAEARVEPLECPSGRSIEETVQLALGGTVEIVVRGAGGGVLAGETVRRSEAGGRRGRERFFGPRGPGGAGGERERVTDEHGIARFEHLAAATHEFTLDEGLGRGGDGPLVVFAGGAADQDDAPKVEVSVTEGSFHTAELQASPRGDLAGVVTEAGRPLAGATVRLSAAPLDSQDEGDPMARMFLGGGPMMMGMGGGSSARTDGDGAYSFAGIKAGRYEISVTHASRQMPASAFVAAEEGETRFDLDLSLSIVAGRIVDQDGEPVAGAQVWAEEAPQGGGTFMSEMVSETMIGTVIGDEGAVVTLGGASGGRVRSDADGRYELRGVDADVELIVKSTHDLMQPAHSAPFRVGHNETRSGVDLEAEVGAAVEVVVLRSDGTPAGMCMAEAESLLPPGSTKEPDSSQQFVGPSGKVRLSGLKPGAWTVRISSFGQGGNAGDPEPQTIELEARETGQLTFTLN